MYIRLICKYTMYSKSNLYIHVYYFRNNTLLLRIILRVIFNNILEINYYKQMEYNTSNTA